MMSALLLLTTLVTTVLFWREHRAKTYVERAYRRAMRLSGFDSYYLDLINKIAKTEGLTPAGKLRVAIPELFPGFSVEQSDKGWFLAHDKLNRLAIDLTAYWQGGEVHVYWMDYEYEPVAHAAKWIITLALDQWTNRPMKWRDATTLKT